jgi:hypothetical protein
MKIRIFPCTARSFKANIVAPGKLLIKLTAFFENTLSLIFCQKEADQTKDDEI